MSLSGVMKQLCTERIPFILTYAVENISANDSRDDSDKIREELSKLGESLTGWIKHDDIQTTYYGKLVIELNELKDKEEHERKEHVKKSVTATIREKLSKDLDTKKAKISMMIMVNGVSEPFEISFDGQSEIHIEWKGKSLLMNSLPNQNSQTYMQSQQTVKLEFELNFNYRIPLKDFEERASSELPRKDV